MTQTRHGLPDSWGQNLAFYRKKYGISQAWLADKLHMARSNLCEVESGKTGMNPYIVEHAPVLLRLPKSVLFPGWEDFT